MNELLNVIMLLYKHVSLEMYFIRLTIYQISLQILHFLQREDYRKKRNEIRQRQKNKCFFYKF